MVKTEIRPVPVPGQVGERPLPPGAVAWRRKLKVFTDGTEQTVTVAVDAHGSEVEPAAPPQPSWLSQVVPWRQVRHRMRLQVRPLFVAGGVVGVATMVDAYTVAPGAVSAGAAAATVAAYVVAPRYLIRESMAAGDVGEDNRPRWVRLVFGARIGFGDIKARSQELVARRRRLAAYVTATAGAWITLADVTGLDMSTPWSKLTWTLLAPLAVIAAKPWLNYVRPRPADKPAEQPEAPAADVVSEPGFGDIIRQRWTSTVGAVAQSERKIPAAQHGDEPEVIPAVVGGKLPGSVLTGIHRVVGGWAAVAVDPHQRGLDWTGAGQTGNQVGPRRQIAAVFGVGLAAVTLEPEAEDANRCFVMVQKESPLRKVVPWDGPGSIDPRKGTGMFGRYADGTTGMYEVYRPGWGCPHDALFGTTGSGKSETFQLLMLIDRWMHYTDRQGRKHGMVADFLIDPQHGQSFGPFMDDLAAPVASSLDEALLLVEAFTAEGLRRNEYLANVEWVDAKGRARKGRKWWNPLVDGPVLVLNVDEAHHFLVVKIFTALLTGGARMWRKCGMKIRLGTHTPLLTDLGGSTALRDMLTGGFVWVGRTNNSITKGAAFNGQLPVDPRSIPKVPGLAYALAGENPRALLLRTAWEEDFYDYVRDDAGEPIGYPAVVPQVTWDTFGREFNDWRGSGLLTPAPVARVAAPTLVDQAVVDAVVEVLGAAGGPLDNRGLDAGLQPFRLRGVPCGLKQVRAAVEKLRADGRLVEGDGYALVGAGAR